MPITSATGLSSGADKNAKNMGVPKIRPNPKPIPGQLQARPNPNQNNSNPNLILTLARPGFRLWAGCILGEPLRHYSVADMYR